MRAWGEGGRAYTEGVECVTGMKCMYKELSACKGRGCEYMEGVECACTFIQTETVLWEKSLNWSTFSLTVTFNI